MNTAQLECFVTLSGTLNYVKAADQLGMTQPAVSKQIQSLEQELEAKLFFRTTRSVSLTPIGQQFLPEATSMLQTYYHTKEWIASYQNTGRMTLHIGYSDPHTLNGLSKILKSIMSRFSYLIPELVYDQTDANLSRLVHGQLDLVIGIRDARFSDDQVIFKKLRDEMFVCAIEKDHPLAKKMTAFPDFDGTITSEHVWPYRQVVSIPPYLMKNYFSRGRRIVPVNDDLDNILCNNVNEAYGLVLAGAGYAFIPSHLVIEHQDLLFLKWKESPHAALGIYHRIAPSEETKKLLDAFVQEAKHVYLGADDRYEDGEEW